MKKLTGEDRRKGYSFPVDSFPKCACLVFERKLERLGINRAKAKTILTWFNAGDRYTNVIQKMNSTNSPVECKTFEVSEWYK